MIIAYSTVSVSLTAVQGHRIACANCGGVYTALESAEHTGSSVGLPVFSSSDSMGDAAFKNLVAGLRPDVTRRAPSARIACPHCRRYPRRTVLGSVARLVVEEPLKGAVLGGIAGPVALMNAGLCGFAAALGIGLAVGTLLGALWAWRKARPLLSERPEPDPRALTDAELADLVDAAEARGRDPFRVWAADAGLGRGMRLVVALGLRDHVGGCERLATRYRPERALAERRAELQPA